MLLDILVSQIIFLQPPATSLVPFDKLFLPLLQLLPIDSGAFITNLQRAGITNHTGPSLPVSILFSEELRLLAERHLYHFIYWFFFRFSSDIPEQLLPYFIFDF